jgi:hypothetical protein
MPTHSLENATNSARDIPAEPKVEAHDPARAAGIAVAAATLGAGAGAAAAAAQGSGGKRALILYDYEKAEDNELELRENEYVSNIDFVDDDWWSGENQDGEVGLFPSNYVELVDDEVDQSPPREEEEEAAPAVAPRQPQDEAGATATALYDYEAAEDNELSFPENATITGVVSLSPGYRPLGPIANVTTGIPRRRLVDGPLQWQGWFVPGQLCAAR